MRILITGGAGYIGSHTVMVNKKDKKLRKQGFII